MCLYCFKTKYLLLLLLFITPILGGCSMNNFVIDPSFIPEIIDEMPAAVDRVIRSIQSIDPNNPIPLYFVHREPAWLDTSRSNSRPLIPPHPMTVIVELAGWHTPIFSGTVHAYLDAEEIPVSFDQSTNLAIANLPLLEPGPHMFAIRTIGHPGFWASTSYEFDIMRNPPTFQAGWEDATHMIITVSPSYPGWVLESPNAFFLANTDNFIIEFEHMFGDSMFKATLDHAFVIPEGIDPRDYNPNFLLVYNGLLGHQEVVIYPYFEL